MTLGETPVSRNKCDAYFLYPKCKATIVSFTFGRQEDTNNPMRSVLAPLDLFLREDEGMSL